MKESITAKNIQEQLDNFLIIVAKQNNLSFYFELTKKDEKVFEFFNKINNTETVEKEHNSILNKSSILSNKLKDLKKEEEV